MNSGKKLYWIAQLSGWTSYALLLLFATYADNPSNVNSILFLYIAALVFFAVLGTHIMRYFFVRLDWLDMKPGPLVPRILIVSLICAIFISVATTGVSFLVERSEISVLDVIINILAILSLVLFWNAIYFTFHFFQKSRNQELNNITLEASRNEVELKNLRSQLNPHFLFNSLNNIRALIELDPAKAKEAVTILSSLLRHSLILGKENLVSLKEELDMVSNYLELEKIRFEERLNVKWLIDESLSQFTVPPFILQMLVENAIKHGISNLVVGGEVIIETKREGDLVIIRVSNTGELKHKEDTGIGIRNTRRRLDIQYKEAVDFELKQEEGKVIAQLTFKN